MNKAEIIWPSTESAYTPDVQPYVDVHGIIDTLLALTTPLTSVGRPSNLLLTGHHGVGKTLLAVNLVKKMEELWDVRIPMITFDCSEDTFELTLIGASRVVAGGETPFIPGPFPAAIHMANDVGVCVLCLEEISALTPGAQKVVNRLTDWRRGIYLSDVGDNCALDDGAEVIIIATMNPSGYGGVYELNADLRSRFDEVEVSLPSHKDEVEILETICPYASKIEIRNAAQVSVESRAGATEYSLSTRDLVRLLSNRKRLEMAGLGTERALVFLANKFVGKDRDLMVDRINAVYMSQLGGRNER